MSAYSLAEFPLRTMAAMKKLLAILASLIVLAAVIVLLLMLRKPPLEIDPRQGKLFVPPRPVPAFSLIDHHRQPIGNAALQGRWTLAMIGFATCPDVCPLTLAEMAGFYTLLAEAPEKSPVPQFLFISVDPFRDTPEVLAEYVEYFRPEFIGLTGSPEAIQSLANGLGLSYVFQDPKTNTLIKDVFHKPALENYAVIHATSVVVINPQGQMVAMLTQPLKAQDIVSHYQKLVRFFGGKS